MSKQININEKLYKTFQAALLLTEEEEEIVVNRLIEKYVHAVFTKAMEKPEVNAANTNHDSSVVISADEQKQLFTKWFHSLRKGNGQAYNPVTISGYTGRIENACCDPIFSDVPVKNLFTITNLEEFIAIQKQIKACERYAEYDARSHNGFTAALRKYEEFLRFQTGDSSIQTSITTSNSAYQQSNVHRWTMEEDLICCKRFLECYVMRQSKTDIVQFLQMLAKEVPDVSEGSLRMKIQNIKYLTVQAKMQDSSTIKWLSQYSMQCKKAFEQAAAELGLLTQS